MNKKITVHIPSPAASFYPIAIVSNALEYIKKYLPRHYQLVIITDHIVEKLYANVIKRYLHQQGYSILLLSFPAGEKYKNSKTKIQIENQMFQHRCSRETCILAVGGGVVGDLAGFIAATYMRGIPYLQLPTSLLAMVDSSIGGKTAIDTPYGKNLIGAFWQPKAVLIDIEYLNTLSKKHFINGLIESIKIFLTSDKKSFYFLEKNLGKILDHDKKALAHVIHRSIKIKAAIVEQDEKELHLRKILNFGHTLGHALEKVTHYKILHGFAVGYGMLLEAKIAELMGYLSASDYFIIQNLLEKLTISSKALKKFSIDSLIQHTQLDKKVKAGNVYYVLLAGIGQTTSKLVHAIPSSMVKKAFKIVTRG